VLDALLMAFPALGLAKIVWAVDVILAMDLPGFSLDALHVADDWHALIAIEELAPGATRRIECDGRAVFVHHGADGPLAYDARCPHQGTEIPHLALHGRTLVCPKHERGFDLATGECVRNGTAPLTRLECRVEDGRVLARW
jgi:nitrite reductase/ring-hydroxylating ferredoxin subunit